MTYAEKLKDPRWQRKRLQILERDGWMCTICQNSSATLHVHHRKYVSGRDPWDYEDSDLTTLCEECHRDVESLKSEIGSLLDFEPLFLYFNECRILLTRQHFVECLMVVNYISNTPEKFRELLAEVKKKTCQSDT